MNTVTKPSRRQNIGGMTQRLVASKTVGTPQVQCGKSISTLWIRESLDRIVTKNLCHSKSEAQVVADGKL
jgi:hypothetical protein